MADFDACEYLVHIRLDHSLRKCLAFRNLLQESSHVYVAVLLYEEDTSISHHYIL
jgi:hypothetical protein